jgi:hypothetical protein
MTDHAQHPIDPTHATITPSGCIVLSGLRDVVVPLARVGGSCIVSSCRLNVDGRCGSPQRIICPTWTPKHRDAGAIVSAQLDPQDPEHGRLGPGE